MHCGNNSKFKQFSLGKSGDCLEISQEQVGFWFLFIPSFHWYLDSNIFSSYFHFSCCHVNIPKAKIQIKPETIILVFRHYGHFSWPFRLEEPKAITLPTLCMNLQCFMCFRNRDEIQLCLYGFLCARSVVKLTHDIAAVQGRAADSCCGKTSLILYSKYKHTTSSTTADVHWGSQEPHGFLLCSQDTSRLDLVCDNF